MASQRQLADSGNELRAGELIFKEGDPAVNMYVVQSGKVRIFRSGPSGDKTLAILGPGEFFGEMALLNNRPRTASAEVLERARLITVEANTFGKMVTDNAEIAVRLLQRLAQRLDLANQRIETLTFRDPRARVACALKQLVQAEGTPTENGSARLTCSSDELAERTALNLKDLDNTLVRLDRLRLTERTPEGFVVPDVGRLDEFLQFVRAQTEGT